MYYITTYQTPLDSITLASDGESLTGLWMECQKPYDSFQKEPIIFKEALPVFMETKRWLDEYFAGKTMEIGNLNIKVTGTDFQKEVWKILMDIPYGKLITYGDIAKQIARKRGLKSMSAQAVGGAVGSNPISIIIPCHRVVGAGGNLTGYAGGVDKKIWLLTHEGIPMTNYWYKG